MIARSAREKPRLKAMTPPNTAFVMIIGKPNHTAATDDSE